MWVWNPKCGQDWSPHMERELLEPGERSVDPEAVERRVLKTLTFKAVLFTPVIKYCLD